MKPTGNFSYNVTPKSVYRQYAIRRTPTSGQFLDSVEGCLWVHSNGSNNNVTQPTMSCCIIIHILNLRIRKAVVNCKNGQCERCVLSVKQPFHEIQCTGYSQIDAKEALSTFAVAATCGNWSKKGQNE